MSPRPASFPTIRAALKHFRSSINGHLTVKSSRGWTCLQLHTGPGEITCYHQPKPDRSFVYEGPTCRLTP